jgi:uncharacterized protein (TIGR03382 family)
VAPGLLFRLPSMRALLALLLLLPAWGYAQSLTLTVSGSPLALNASGCSNGVAGSWTGSGLTAACNTLQVWLTASSACGALPSTTASPPDVVVATAQAGDLNGGLSTAPFSFNFNLLPSFTTNACGASVDFTNYLCASVTSRSSTGTCDGTVTQAASVSIRYDNVPPPAPVVTVTPLDSKLTVRLTPSGSGTDVTDVQYFNVEFAVDPGDAGAPVWLSVGGNVSVNNPAVTISNLVNGTTYLVRGYSKDEASNLSPPSDPVAAQPVLTNGFFSNYIADGGQDKGGCAATGGAPSVFGLVALLLVTLARRRE